MPTTKKVVKTASQVPTSPAGVAVSGGRAAAKWALDKYRAYSKSKRDKAAAERKRKAEAGADRLYGKGTTIKPPAKPATPPKTMPASGDSMKKTETAIEKRNRRLREENPDKK